MVGKTIHGKERALILKILTFFEREKEISKFLIPVDPTKGTKEACKHDKVNKKVIIPVDQPINRTCAATGISKSTLMRIKKQVKPAASSVLPVSPSTPGKKRQPSSKKINLDSFDLVALRNIVNSFYTDKKEVPTLKKILAAAKKDLIFPGERTTLRHILKQLGYRFKKCKNARLVLIQKPDIAAWRARYLRRMIENNDLGANKKPVTYLNGTWINSLDTVRKCWQNSSNSSVNKNSNLDQRWILLHAGGENGFISGAELLHECKRKTGNYHDEIDMNNFFMWLKEKIIPNLPPNSIVVIDNVPYHSMQSEKIPHRASLKTEMQEWLLKNNINYDEKMTKPELYHLIVSNKPEKTYVVDLLLWEHGHEVVRLPPYHSDLNPIEYIWNLIKQRVADKMTDQSEKYFKKMTRKAINSITATDWKNEINRVERLQKEYWEQDRIQENIEREFIITQGGEESSSESESEQEDDSDVDMEWWSSEIVEMSNSDDSA